jgi:hypothetical protein
MAKKRYFFPMLAIEWKMFWSEKGTGIFIEVEGQAENGYRYIFTPRTRKCTCPLSPHWDTRGRQPAHRKLCDAPPTDRHSDWNKLEAEFEVQEQRS